MRPRKLRMENIGPFKGTAELDFDALGDIFLISGRTGSGKTTIFDSICYALYGSLPGARRDHVRRLRSDFADEGAPCAVSLTFSLGSLTYRVDRSPPRLRRKSRGEGWVEDPETASLYRLDEAGGATAEGGKKSDVDGRIQDLLGLSLEEFSKIVLLPQGEFAEFLRQKTADRQAVLGKLFPVDLAVRVREIANSRKKEAEARLAEAERRVADRLSSFKVDDYEATRAEAEASLTRLDGEILRLEAERTALEAAARAVKEERETEERLAEEAEKEKALVTETAAMRRMETEVEASRSARPFVPILRRKEEALREASAAAEAAAEASRRADELRAGKAALDALLPETERAERELAGLRERRGPLVAAVREEKETAEEAAEIDRLARCVRESERLAAEESAAAGVRAAEASELRSKAEAADALEDAWEEARNGMDRARAVKPLADRYEKLAADAARAKRRFDDLGDEIRKRSGDLEVLKAELAELEERIAAEEIAGRAAILAAELRPGTACPVCGSTVHPAPAAARAPAFGLKDRREARSRSVEDAAKILAAKDAEREGAGKEAARLQAEAEETRVQCAAAAGSPAEGYLPPSAAAAAADLAAKASETNGAYALRMEAKKAKERIAAIHRETADFREREAAEAAKRSELSAALAVKSAAAADRAARRSRAITEFGEEGTAEGSAEEALAALDRRISSMEHDTRRRRADRETAGAACAAAEAEERAAAELAAERRRIGEQAAAECGAALGKSRFSGEADLRAAVLDDEEEKRRDASVNDWKERLAKARTVREGLERELALKRTVRTDREREAGADGKEVQAELEKNRGLREKATGDRDGATAALAALDGEKAAYEEADRRRIDLSREAAAIRSLSDDLSGNNPKKRAFDSWLLGLYLEEVAAYASKRLERMSDGRYRLVMDADREGGRGRTGLDLSVFDAYTGRARPCGTLSGGESFMASISLALGLADSIQARSGGIRLDAVFIDEGFGSLDEASLDKALSILDEIRDHRMVGLISHVGELRSRIPGRVEIVKTSVGSLVATEAAES